MTINAARVREILEHADRYYVAYHAADTFGGPSLFFHRRALDTRHAPPLLRHLEYVYATLASWGMHRMGRGGSKMRTFEEFRASIEPLRPQIAAAQGFRPDGMREAEWFTLKHIFVSLRIMKSGTSLVGNSKVMHHMLPNIVPPIDRQYTLRYLYGATTIANDVDGEWRMMREIMSGFFLPVANDAEFSAKANRWIALQRPWDTSVMKVIDNVLIGSRILK